MGTRADFYVGKGKAAEWIGSVAYDGYPDGIGKSVLTAVDEQQYRQAVLSFLEGEEAATLPEMGWPWPWEDSNTTDYAYAFDQGKVHGYSFAWFDPLLPEPDEGDPEEEVFPKMDISGYAKAGSARSGIMLITRANA